MEKLKWKYDKKNHEWYVPESNAYAGDNYSIKKLDDEFVLFKGYFTFVGRFKKLSNAKQVPNLLRYG